MARSAWSLRVKTAARPTSAFSRSGFAVFSLSISGPQTLRTLSSSLAAIAAMHGAESAGGTVALSGPVACSRGENQTALARIAILTEARIGLFAHGHVQRGATCYHDSGGFAAKIREPGFASENQSETYSSLAN